MKNYYFLVHDHLMYNNREIYTATAKIDTFARRKIWKGWCS